MRSPGAAHHDVVTRFTAMASPCAVLVDTPDDVIGRAVALVVETEALRIEAKFTRYAPSTVTHINANAGAPMEVDEETADLLDYAALCHRLSDGLFDITSGALRRVWRFDARGRGSLPDAGHLAEILRHVGWQRVSWVRPTLALPAGMEIDFGGIGKEYAVDRALKCARARFSEPVLVNLGGDLAVSGPRDDGTPWRVAIEDVDEAGAAAGLIDLSQGALATSGDAHRFILADGVRYGHVLDPRTGWPVGGAPRSVTVHAGTCTEAGLLAKLALLRGPQAEDFLKRERVRAWCVR